MALRPSRSPARSGLAGATAVFALIVLLGIGWILREGKIQWLPTLLPNWTAASSAADSGNTTAVTPGLTLLDSQTQSHADRGAVVGIGQFTVPGQVTIGQTVYRFWGVDTDPVFAFCQPNTHGWACGTRAAQALASYTQGGLVACYDRGTGAKGEHLGQCFRGVIDLGGMLVDNGFATELPGETANYHIKQAWAKDHRLGMWFSP